MHCPKCNKRMKKQLWGFCYYYVCEYCGYIVLTSEVENEIKEWFTRLPSPYFLTHKENKVDISKIKISESGEVVLKTEEEQTKNNVLSDNLAKAIKLLKRFVELENCTLDYDDIKEAEQFLSEVENV